MSLALPDDQLKLLVIKSGIVDEKQFAELLNSVRWMKAHQADTSDKPSIALPDVAAIRARTHLRQADFAQLIGVSVRTLQNWEQGHRRPTGAAAALLRAVAADPAAVIQALHGGQEAA
jgi:putative transcriptional regulator